MGVTSYTVTQYFIECDSCGISECAPDGNAENIHNKQQAIKWAKMHRCGDKVLCDKCFREVRNRQS